MASNRQQRRAAMRKGKRPGETYADQLAKQKMIKESVDRMVYDESVALESDIKTQRFLWMSVAALNMAFGFWGVRIQRYMLALDDVREDLEKMAKEDGWEYAIEKLREQCAKITGMEVKQVHEEEMIQARKENEAKGIFFNAEDPEDLARIGFTGAPASAPAWIPVTERLPERGQEVIVYCGGVLKPIVCTTFFWNKDYNNWARVTHWMELPDRPEVAVHG